MCGGRIPQKVVQPIAGLQLLFKPQAGRERRTPHKLSDLRRVGRLQVIFAQARLQFHERGDF